MQFQAIQISKLEMEKPSESKPFSHDLASTLADSVKTDGLIHAPTVVAIKDKPGHFDVIAGRHRVYAVGRILGWTEVWCHVADADEAKQVEAITLAENLFRGTLSREQRNKNLIRWHEIFTEKHPDSTGQGAYKRQVRDAREAGDGSTPKTFTKTLQETLGVSPSVADRLTRVAKNLKEEDVTVLAANNATEGVVNDVAALGDPEAVGTAVKLIGSGMNHKEAVRQASKLSKPKKPKTPKDFKPAELTDEEWLRTFCASVIAGLKHKASYRNDAILYRNLQEALVEFRRKIRKAVDESKSKKNDNGTFFSNLYRLLHCSHPMHWMVCGICTGTGRSEQDEKKACYKCVGAGYVMKMED